MRFVADAMGVSTDRRKGVANRANYNRVQTITRTWFNTAQNVGAYDAYSANQDILSGAEWLTCRDERVCAICSGLDGKVWSFDDPAREQPPAHPNCRCNIIPVIDPSWLLPDLSRPPGNTFAEFVAALYLEHLLRDFLAGRKIESERV